MPPESKSNSIRVYAINNPTVSGTFSTGTTASTYLPDIPFSQADINFDIPCSQGKSVFADCRMTIVNFRAVVTVGTPGSLVVTNANLRSSAYSYFDQITTRSQSGGVLEQVPEYGLTVDSILSGQMSAVQV
jgi:hypothetical protein